MVLDLECIVNNHNLSIYLRTHSNWYLLSFDLCTLHKYYHKNMQITCYSICWNLISSSANNYWLLNGIKSDSSTRSIIIWYIAKNIFPRNVYTEFYYQFWTKIHTLRIIYKYWYPRNNLQILIPQPLLSIYWMKTFNTQFSMIYD